MKTVRIDRSFRSCTTVVVVFSITTFWLPTLLWVDLTHSIAGFLGGRVGATPFKGVVSGFVGGVVVAVLYLLAYALAGVLDGWALLTIAAIPCYTTFFGAVGGISARTP